MFNSVSGLRHYQSGSMDLPFKENRNALTLHRTQRHCCVDETVHSLTTEHVNCTEIYCKFYRFFLITCGTWSDACVSIQHYYF